MIEANCLDLCSEEPGESARTTTLPTPEMSSAAVTQDATVTSPIAVSSRTGLIVNPAAPAALCPPSRLRDRRSVRRSRDLRERSASWLTLLGVACRTLLPSRWPRQGSISTYMKRRKPRFCVGRVSRVERFAGRRGEMRSLTGRITGLNGQDSTYHTRDLLIYGNGLNARSDREAGQGVWRGALGATTSRAIAVGRSSRHRLSGFCV